MSEEKIEKETLEKVIEQINSSIQVINSRIAVQRRDMEEAKNHLQEHKRDMDHLEKNAIRESVSNMALVGKASVDKKKRLLKLRNTPYFGRLDFKEEGSEVKQTLYVGVHNFKDEAKQENLIYDWRAPISSMFYDFEPGNASYETREGKIKGKISLKRQFRIREGVMEYMLDNDIAIQDEVLQKELKQASSAKMKNIVATIQREQNAIIRNEEAENLIIQGVAGSGKTSIALHRIAFLLYKFKETISSNDILIISPNKVFANYISNVLPELGEETVKETSLEEIADELFDYQIKFQSFFDQVSELLEKNNQNLIARTQFKSSPVLLKKMDEYLVHLENTAFEPRDVIINKKPIPAWFIEEKFQQYNRMPLFKRFNEVVREVVNNVFMFYKYEVKGKERTELHTTIRKMFPSTNLRGLYRGFYEWMGEKDLLKMKKGGKYEYGDVFPLLYLKMKLEGLAPYYEVKHLVVDEMQDYSPVQYKILSQLFPCKKTILGDINQAVNPYSSSNLQTIENIFPNSTSMTMLKSYRSTYEITEFSKKVGNNTKVEALERHGEEPKVSHFKNHQEELAHIIEQLKKFRHSENNSCGVICKTPTQTNDLYEKLSDQFVITLLDGRSVAFQGGIVVTTAHLAKGLEFDQVIVPHCSATNYKTATDRQMLYVACTRAMHQLEVTATGKLSSFLR